MAVFPNGNISSGNNTLQGEPGLAEFPFIIYLNYKYILDIDNFLQKNQEIKKITYL